MPTTVLEDLPRPEHVRELAADLIRALAEHAGDDSAVCSVLSHWQDTLGTRDLSLVCMAAVRATFGHCLIPHPDRVPADGLTLDPPTTGATP